MSYHLVPRGPPSGSESVSLRGAHDTLEYGPYQIAAHITSASTSDLEQRLTGWDKTQDMLKLNISRNLSGLHAPLRFLLERHAVTRGPVMSILPHARLHHDVLMGEDEILKPGDIFMGMEQGPSMEIHAAMEKKLKL